MQMVLLSAVLASPLSTCRGTGGSIAVAQLLFPLQNMQAAAMLSDGTESRWKNGRGQFKMSLENFKIVLVDHKPFY